MTSLRLRDPPGKILDIEKLAEVIGTERRTRRARVVHCHGVFDLLHVGHIRHLRQARALGDILVVTVTPDEHVNKGPGRPAFTAALRAESLAALDAVDYVAVNRWPTAVEPIRMLRPDFYVKGPDYRDTSKDITGGIGHEEEAVRSVGGRLVITEDITFSSSTLINRFLPVFPDEVRSFLDGFRQRHSAQEVLGYLERARDLRVLVVGEAIIDEYEFIEPLGKSAKEPILASRYLSSERYAGGALAVANHLAVFCREVGLISLVGARDGLGDFARTRLRPNVRPQLLPTRDAPTIIKRRFVENHYLQKLFEIYVMDDGAILPEETQELCGELDRQLPGYDAVVVVDYGHGMLGREAVKSISSGSAFLALNTQTNAGNRGFNTVSKYPRADYVCLAQHELSMETRDPRGDLRQQVAGVAAGLRCRRFMVTRGKWGNLSYGEGEGFFEVPAFGQRILDRVGAGDAVLAITSFCARLGAPMEVVGFVGNAVGAQAVTIVGNKASVERVPLAKYVETMLK